MTIYNTLGESVALVRPHLPTGYRVIANEPRMCLDLVGPHGRMVYRFYEIDLHSSKDIIQECYRMAIEDQRNRMVSSGAMGPGMAMLNTAHHKEMCRLEAAQKKASEPYMNQLMENFFTPSGAFGGGMSAGQQAANNQMEEARKHSYMHDLLVSQLGLKRPSEVERQAADLDLDPDEMRPLDYLRARFKQWTRRV